MAVLKGNFVTGALVAVAVIAMGSTFVALKNEKSRIEAATNIRLASANIPDQSADAPQILLPSIPPAAHEPVPALRDARTPENHLHEDSAPENVTQPELSAFGLPCDIGTELELRPGAMLLLSVSAPCQQGQTVRIHHAGLELSQIVPDTGLIEVSIPALAEVAKVSVNFASGVEHITETQVPSLSEFVRVALIGDHNASLSLHALEFGAQHGERGHVWSGQARNPDQSGRTHGGFMSVLEGTDSRIEVYSFPGLTLREGAVRLSVELEITHQNCGQEVMSETHELRQGEMRSLDLSFAVPTCDAVGDILVLNNLLQDLKIARN